MPERYVIGCRIQGEITHTSLDYAFAWLIRWVQPRLEIVLGLMGIRNVRFDQDFARSPMEDE